MSWLMNPIYNVISWILLRWHWVWDAILPNGTFLGTTWDWVLAIVFLVITVRVILFPIFVKQIRSQRAMQAIAPKVKELQAKHKGDQQTLREEMMKLYQTEKVNPLMGCLPLLLQIPVFFGLFHTLRYINPLTVTDKTQYGWTVEKFDSAAVARLLTAPIPASFSDSSDKLAQLGSHGAAVKVVAGVLVIVMMLTTFMTSRQMILKTGWSQDPQQRMIQKLMLYGIPFSLLLSGWAFPIGVIIYWVTQNLFSLGQQFWVLHKYPPPVNEAAIPTKGGAKSRADSASVNEPGAIARFFQVKPKTTPPATPAPRAGFIGGPTERLTRGTLFKRRTAPTPPPAPPAPRSLAPKPGAKPKITGPVTSTENTDGDSTSSGPASANPPAANLPAAKSTARPAAKAGGAKQPTTKSTPTVPTSVTVGTTPSVGRTPTIGSSPAGPKPAAPSKDAGNGASSNGASSNGASSDGGPSNGPSNGASTGGVGQASNGGSSNSGSSSGGAPRAGGGRPGPAKATPPRKSQPNRKGGGKR